MKFSATLPFAFLVLTTYAGPFGIQDYLNRLAARKDVSQPSSERIGKEVHADLIVRQVNTETIQNWAGAIVDKTPGGTYTSASSVFTVPTIKHTGSDGPESVDLWVGIDDKAAKPTILQAGVQVTVQASGAITYDPWWAFYPAPRQAFGGFTFTAGDVIRVQVTAVSPTQGAFNITNTSKSINSVAVSQKASSPFTGNRVDWIVAQYARQDSVVVPLPNFQSVVFKQATASTSSKNTADLRNAVPINIKRGNTVRTNSRVDSTSQVSVNFVQ